MDEVVKRLRTALSESQTRLAVAETALKQTEQALDDSMRMVLAAAQEIAPLRRLVECIDVLDRLQRDDPYGEQTDSRLLDLIESRDKGLAFYRETKNPERATRLQQHARRLALKLAAAELEKEGDRECVGVAARLRRLSEAPGAYRITDKLPAPAHLPRMSRKVRVCV
jgi:hypothetical protein